MKRNQGQGIFFKEFLFYIALNDWALMLITYYLQMDPYSPSLKEFMKFVIDIHLSLLQYIVFLIEKII